MVLFDVMTGAQLKLLKEVGIDISDRNYSMEEMSEMKSSLFEMMYSEQQSNADELEQLWRCFFGWCEHQHFKDSLCELEGNINTYKHPEKKNAGFLNDWMRSSSGPCKYIWPVSKQMPMEHRQEADKHIVSYLLVLGKRWDYGMGEGHIIYPLEKRIMRFAEFLSEGLLEGQSLIHKNKAFCIVDPSYEIHYYIEAYKKQPDKQCYMENNKPQVVHMKRIGAARSFYDLKKTDGVVADDKDWVFHKMNDPVEVE